MNGTVYKVCPHCGIKSHFELAGTLWMCPTCLYYCTTGRLLDLETPKHHVREFVEGVILAVFIVLAIIGMTIGH